MASKTRHPQSSYDALLVHGVMIVAFLAMVTAVSLMPEDKDSCAVWGVGLSATVVFGTWSFVLAMRAKLRQEASRWSTVVIVLCILELGSVGVSWVWQDLASTLLGCVPFSLPCLPVVLAGVVRHWSEKRGQGRRL